MKTIIELYDTSPIENVLGIEMFRPNEMILICPPEIEQDRALRRSLRKYFEYRKCPVKLTFVPVSMLDAVKIERVLREVLDAHPDSAIDISGGTDAALFAAGAVSGEASVFTYSRKRNTFFEIKNAPFARGLPCTVQLDAKSCFLMAGGTLLPGRADNEALKNMMPEIRKLFDVFTKYRRVWNRQISYIQKISSSEPGMLDASGRWTEKAGDRNVKADAGLLDALAKAGLILDLVLGEEEITFRFPNETVRFWLRDIGSVLEVQVFRACLLAGCFDDVVLSAIVNWQGLNTQRDSVTNEIDVMAVQGIQPVLISCKTCEIHTEALNELAILRDRFGGKFSRAIIVTSATATKNREPMRRRADELGIEVVEWDDLRVDRLVRRLLAPPMR
jgi:hypothetical protein